MNILFFFLCFANSLQAQEINPLSPSKAAFYSAVVPGLGQAYNKKYWKVPLVYGGLATSFYYFSWNNREYKKYRDEYKRRLNGTSDANHPIYGTLSNDILIRGQRFHQRNRDLSALLMAGVYMLNVVDANIDAHLLQFNVNEHLSVVPQISQSEIDYNKLNTGIKLTFNF